METVNKPIQFLTPSDHQNNTVFVLGQTGTGKTVLISNMVNDETDRRVFVVDTQEQFSLLVATHCVNLKEVVTALDQAKRKIVFHCDSEDEDSINAVQKILFVHQDRNGDKLPAIVFATDELGAFCTDRYAPKGIIEITNRGRLRKIDRIYGTQWFRKIPAFVRDAVSEIYAFNQQDKNAVEFLESFGLNTEAEIPLNELPVMQCYHVVKGTTTKINLVPESKVEVER
jgi:hypothetical protein